MFSNNFCRKRVTKPAERTSERGTGNSDDEDQILRLLVYRKVEKQGEKEEKQQRHGKSKPQSELVDTEFITKC